MPLAESAAPDARASYCRFTPSKSSGALDGKAALRLTGIEIDLGPGQPRRVWHYGSLRALEPLRPNAIDVLLSSREERGASLFVQGREFCAGLVGYAPQLSARADRWRRARPWLFVTALIAAFFVATQVASWSPLRAVAGALPESWRVRLGNAARDSMTEGHKQCADAAGVAALARLTERLSKAAPVKRPFDVRVYDWSLMNAFAVPGEEIVLMKGLIDKAQSPDEVAGVLAHEMGHGIEMHPEVSILRSVGFAAGIEIMLGGTGGGLANIGVMLAQLGYSRNAERQADKHALELLKGAGIAPKGLSEFFTRVMKMEKDEGNGGMPRAFAWFRTHPPVAERAELVRHQPDYPSTPALDAQSWQDLKTICKTTVEPQKGDGEK